MLGGDNSATPSPSPAPAPAPSGAPAPSPPSGAATPWYEPLKPELKGLLEKKGWNTPDHAGLEKALGAYTALEKQFHESDKLMLPKDPSADPAAMDAVYNRLGRPETADKYTFPEGVDQATVRTLAPELHKIGITQAQATALAQIDIQRQQQAQQAQAEKVKADGDAAMAKLSAEWGANTPKEIEFNRRAMRALGMTVEQASAYMSAGGAETFMRLLNIAGRSQKEDPTAGIGHENSLGFGMTPNRAAAMLAEKGNDLRRRAMTGDKAAKAELKRLQMARAGEA
jgi:hypothetical protein